MGLLSSLLPIGNVSGGGQGGQPVGPSRAESGSDPYTNTTVGPFVSGAGQRGPVITIGGDSKVNPAVEPAGISWLWLGGGILGFLLFLFLILRR